MYESRRVRPDDRIEGVACGVDQEPPTPFALGTYMSVDVSVISIIFGQKGDETTRSERVCNNN